MKERGKVVASFEAFVVSLRPPRLVIERAELSDGRGVGDDEKTRDLLVAAVGCFHRGFEDQPQVRER